MRAVFLAVPALWLSAAAAAQDRPDPLDARAKVPPVEFRSAFERYRPYSEQKLRDWRRSNDEVGTAGRHEGHHK